MKAVLALGLMAALFAPAGLDLGKPVPDADLGEAGKLSAHKGKVVAVYFWSEKCPFGPPHFKLLESLGAKYAKNDKVKLVAVSSFGEAKDAVSAWAKANAKDYPIVHDGDRALAKHFGAKKVNATYVIDGAGNLVYRGGIESLGDAIEAALAGKPAPASDKPFDGCGIKN